MEQKRLKEQIAVHSYKEQLAAVAAAAQTRKRVVKLPETVQSEITWNMLADRRAQLRRTNATPQTKPPLVQRTLAQTGGSAPGRRMARPMRKSLPRPTRASRQRSASRWGFLRRILAFFALLVLVVLGVSFALTSSAFRVQQVSVVGTQNRVLVDTIQHMGIRGQNIFLVDTEGLRTRIEAFPMVASVALGKQLPNQLTVTVLERTPVLLWQTKQGTYSVDQSGIVIAPASQISGSDRLKTVEAGNSRQPIHPGVQLNGAEITFAMEVFNRLPQVTGITSFIVRYDPNIYVEGENGSYVVESATGWAAYLGGPYDANPLNNRLIELQQILALAQQEQLHLATIDLRFGLRPVYTLKQ